MKQIHQLSLSIYVLRSLVLSLNISSSLTLRCGVRLFDSNLKLELAMSLYLAVEMWVEVKCVTSAQKISERVSDSTHTTPTAAQVKHRSRGSLCPSAFLRNYDDQRQSIPIAHLHWKCRQYKKLVFIIILSHCDLREFLLSWHILACTIGYTVKYYSF